jgi:hypothetical protein
MTSSAVRAAASGERRAAAGSSRLAVAGSRGCGSAETEVTGTAGLPEGIIGDGGQEGRVGWTTALCAACTEAEAAPVICADVLADPSLCNDAKAVSEGLSKSGRVRTSATSFGSTSRCDDAGLNCGRAKPVIASQYTLSGADAETPSHEASGTGGYETGMYGESAARSGAGSLERRAAVCARRMTASAITSGWADCIREESVQAADLPCAVLVCSVSIGARTLVAFNVPGSSGTDCGTSKRGETAREGADGLSSSVPATRRRARAKSGVG